LTDAEGFDYVTSEDILAEFKSVLGDVEAGSYKPGSKLARPNGADAPADEIDTPLYSGDGLVRRATALQQTLVAKRSAGDE
jgi:hypothetical protein